MLYTSESKPSSGVRIILLILSTLLLGGGIGFYFGYDHGYERAASLWELLGENGENVSTQNTTTYTDEEFGFSLRYPSGDEGYRAVPAPDNPHDSYVISFLKKKDYEELRGSAEPREGPPAITVSLFTNHEEHIPLAEWITTKQESNYALGDGTAPMASSVAGTPVLTYRWSGLYEGESTAFEHGGHVFILSFTYLDNENEMRKDFEDIRASFIFH